MIVNSWGELVQQENFGKESVLKAGSKIPAEVEFAH